MPHRSICVVSAQRTGSYLLMKMLSEERFTDLGEVFNRNQFVAERFAGFDEGVDEIKAMRYSDPAKFVDKYLLDRSGHRDRSPVWKYQYQNIFSDEGQNWKPLLRKAIQDRPEICLVLLTRENLVARFVSRQMARQTQQFVLMVDSEAAVPPENVKIEPKHLLYNIKRVQDQTHQVESMLARDRFVHVTYEEVVDDPIAVSERMSEAFDVEISFDEPKTVKQGRSLAESIENFDEVCEALADTEWERFCHLP